VLTLRFQSTGRMPGAAEAVAMRGANLTIGRGEENDLVLPDPDRTISKRHCVLERHGARVVVIDLSTNGTFLNYAKTPVGKTPATLSPGDVLSLGAYELVVEMSDEPAPPAEPIPPVEDWPRVRSPQEPEPAELLGDRDDVDFLDALLGTDTVPKGPRQFIPEDPLDVPDPLPDDEDPILGPPTPRAEPVATGRFEHRAPTQDYFAPPPGRAVYLPEGWDEEEDSFGAASAPPPAAAVPPPAPAADELLADLAPGQVPAPAAAAPPPRAAAAPATGGGRDAVAAFLTAAGLEDAAIPEAELDETMARLGAVLQILVTGVREVLMTRTAIKSEFRMEQTTVRAGDNNPLKFSVTPEQALAALARPARGYLAPTAAAAEAMRDIRAHEVAMVTGMEAALKGVLARLDPQALAGALEGGGGLASLFKGRKERYWEAYEAMYAEIADQAQNDFHEVFGREFARAYQAQVRKL
jgi:type VI secretion system protein ImpI/type VI secretion system protein